MPAQVAIVSLSLSVLVPWLLNPLVAAMATKSLACQHNMDGI